MIFVKNYTKEIEALCVNPKDGKRKILDTNPHDQIN